MSLTLEARLKIEGPVLTTGKCRNCGNPLGAHAPDEKCLFDSSSLLLNPLERFLAEVGERQGVGRLVLHSTSGVEIPFLVQLRSYSSTLTQLRPYIEIELLGYSGEPNPLEKF